MRFYSHPSRLIRIIPCDVFPAAAVLAEVAPMQTALSPLRQQHPPTDVDDAYAIQHEMTKWGGVRNGLSSEKSARPLWQSGGNWE